MTARLSQLDSGFSLIEMLVAVAILTSTSALLFHFLASGQRLVRSVPDAADAHQRLRAAASLIERDLLMAGAGVLHGTRSGPLVNHLAPIVPARTGARNADAELSWHADRVSIVYVPDSGWHARLSSDMASAQDDVPINPGDPGCPGAGLCGFTAGSRAAVIEGTGLGAGHDLFTVSGIAAGLAHAPPNVPFARAYSGAHALVVPIVHHVYYLDRIGHRLMLYDGYVTDLPLVDNVVDLRFAYFADPLPTSAPWPDGAEGNCAYSPGDPPVPLLVHLGGSSLAPVGQPELTDGPACGLPPNRFDADLLRVRRVRVTIRIQVGDARLRGSGDAFHIRGSSAHGESYVQDFEVSFDVAPRNMHPTR